MPFCSGSAFSSSFSPPLALPPTKPQRFLLRSPESYTPNAVGLLSFHFTWFLWWITSYWRFLPPDSVFLPSTLYSPCFFPTLGFPLLAHSLNYLYFICWSSLSLRWHISVPVLLVSRRHLHPWLPLSHVC